VCNPGARRKLEYSLLSQILPFVDEIVVTHHLQYFTKDIDISLTGKTYLVQTCCETALHTSHTVSHISHPFDVCQLFKKSTIIK
jgi:hypothetical protein